MQIARRWLVVLLCTAPTVLATGCGPGIRWRLGFYEDAQADGQAQNRLTFVYFRSFSSVACTNFEDTVLEQQAVLDATADLVCVPLDVFFERDRRLMESWGINAAPAIAIVDPSGSVLETGSGDITVEDLLATIQRARDQFMAASQPTESP